MLTIEEQIERIADHALERASAPERQPRRWPAMAAAAVVLLAAGSVVWMVSDRDPTDIAVAPSETPSLSARLEGAEEYPLTATEADDDISTGLVIEEPGTLAAVTTAEGVTVFRASGLMTAPGTEVYQARCVGIPRVSVGCDVPAFEDLPWVAGTPFVPESEALSIWVDVPADAAAVLITDGTVVRWQAPVAGLAVWPQPTDPGWRAEALDVTGDTILMVDESTKKQMRTAAAEAFDPTETARGDQAVLQQVRDCLVANGAKFGADNVRPVVGPGVSAQEIWALCVGPLFAPSETTQTATNPIDSTNMVIDPAPPGDPFRIDVTSAESSLRIYAQDRPDPENGPWIMIGWSPDGTAGVPTIGDPLEPDRQFFDAGRGYVVSRNIDPVEVRRLINGAAVEPDGRRSIEPTDLPDGLVLAFDGDSVSDVGRRTRGGAASELAWWAEPVNGPFVRLLIADDPDMSGWRTGRVGNNSNDTTVTDTMVDGHPAYVRSGASVRVLSWHDGSRWLQLVASDATDQELLDLAMNVRQAEPAEWSAIRLDTRDTQTPVADRATVGPPGSNTTPILGPTTIGSVQLQDGTLLSIAAADFGILTLSDADGFVIESIIASAAGAVGRAMRITGDASPAAATGDLVYGIVVAGSTITIRDDATGEEVPVALSDSTKPVNGFIGFAARLSISTTYASMSINDPITGANAESRIGY